MKFLQILGNDDCSSFTSFEFEDHEVYIVNVGDQIWSNGHEIQIADYVDACELDTLIEQVSNKTAFKGALRRLGFI